MRTEAQNLISTVSKLSLLRQRPRRRPVVLAARMAFPKCWYSWRPSSHRTEAMQGYRVYAPECEATVQPAAPEDPAQYDLMTLCGDIQRP